MICFLKPMFLLVLLVGPTVFLSCKNEDGNRVGGSEATEQEDESHSGDKKDEHPGLGQSRSHDELLKQLDHLKREFLEELVGVSNRSEARSFVEGLDVRFTEIRKLLEEARSLPDPQAEIRKQYRENQEALSRNSAALMKDFWEKLENRPDGGAVREILGVLFEDREVEEVNQAFESIYGVPQ